MGGVVSFRPARGVDTGVAGPAVAAVAVIAAPTVVVAGLGFVVVGGVYEELVHLTRVVFTPRRLALPLLRGLLEAALVLRGEAVVGLVHQPVAVGEAPPAVGTPAGNRPLVRGRRKRRPRLSGLDFCLCSFAY